MKFAFSSSFFSTITASKRYPLEGDVFVMAMLIGKSQEN